jgi:hypothetical protein
VTEEDKQALVGEIADELLDVATFETRADRELAAGLVADRIEPWLYRQGWMPPETYENVQAWATRTGNLPEHHVNRDVLTSHLAELAAILHDR